MNLLDISSKSANISYLINKHKEYFSPENIAYRIYKPKVDIFNSLSDDEKTQFIRILSDKYSGNPSSNNDSSMSSSSNSNKSFVEPYFDMINDNSHSFLSNKSNSAFGSLDEEISHNLNTFESNLETNTTQINTIILDSLNELIDLIEIDLNNLIQNDDQKKAETARILYDKFQQLLE